MAAVVSDFRELCSCLVRPIKSFRLVRILSRCVKTIRWLIRYPIMWCAIIPCTGESVVTS